MHPSKLPILIEQVLYHAEFWYLIAASYTRRVDLILLDQQIRILPADAKHLMQERDMNLCVLAKKCGISYSTIQTTARRGGQLSVETIERICLGLGITLKDFFDSSYL